MVEVNESSAALMRSVDSAATQIQVSAYVSLLREICQEADEGGTAVDGSASFRVMATLSELESSLHAQ